MALSDADRREIADLIRSALEPVREEMSRRGGTGYSRSEAAMAEATNRAVAPLALMDGDWKLASAGAGGQEAVAASGPVQFDRFENKMHAGGKVMVTNFTGRFRQGMEAGGTRVQQGEQFGGIMVLAYDAPNNQYIELYADDMGKVNLSTTQRYEVDGQTVRLFHDEYVAEYSSRGPNEFTFNLYEARGGRGGSEAGGGRGAPIKSASLRRQ